VKESESLSSAHFLDVLMIFHQVAKEETKNILFALQGLNEKQPILNYYHNSTVQKDKGATPTFDWRPIFIDF
jgi:hypothetical protein